MTDYYNRKVVIVEGGRSYANADDAANEELVKALMEEEFGSKLIKLGHYDSVDFLSIKNGVTEAVVEVKGRDELSTTHETVFFNRRKNKALKEIANGFKCQPFYAVKFKDRVLYIDITDADELYETRMGGTLEEVKSTTDVELMIHIPIEDMIVLKVL